MTEQIAQIIAGDGGAIVALVLLTLGMYSIVRMLIKAQQATNNRLLNIIEDDNKVQG